MKRPKVRKLSGWKPGLALKVGDEITILRRKRKKSMRYRVIATTRN